MSDLRPPETPSDVLRGFATEPAPVFSPEQLNSMTRQMNDLLGFKEPNFLEKCKDGLKGFASDVGRRFITSAENVEASLSLGLTQTLKESILSGELQAPKNLSVPYPF